MPPAGPCETPGTFSRTDGLSGQVRRSAWTRASQETSETTSMAGTEEEPDQGIVTVNCSRESDCQQTASSSARARIVTVQRQVQDIRTPSTAKRVRDMHNAADCGTTNRQTCDTPTTTPETDLPSKERATATTTRSTSSTSRAACAQAREARTDTAGPSADRAPPPGQRDPSTEGERRARRMSAAAVRPRHRTLTGAPARNWRSSRRPSDRPAGTAPSRPQTTAWPAVGAFMSMRRFTPGADLIADRARHAAPQGARRAKRCRPHATDEEDPDPAGGW